ncbi:hypothetical protein [Natronoflexus pectinivorans]|uniref:Membrane protein DUF2157 n=1 Tax=Natronoflexus pectinivorans TaxID=682526 RepID=A0A4R2GIL2_9BACT|nr:hypothetical protein [Natronoflexus pectinivorans]TCO08358.1 hypothetical protein EV194_105162 [Natronoflexus pectinivorans]
MKISRKQNILVEKLLRLWVQKELLSEEKADELRADVEIKSLNWKRIARNLMGLSVLFMVIAFLHLVVDKWVLEIITRFFSLSSLFFMGLLAVLTILFVWLANIIYKRKQLTVISVEALLLLSIISFSGAVYYAVKAFDFEDFYKVLPVFITGCYSLVVASFFRSSLIWIVGLVGFSLWMTLETARLGNWGSTFLGMNLPLRWLVFSSLFLLMEKFIPTPSIFKTFFRITIQFWLIIFWVSLWLFALFGNYSSIESWDNASAVDLLPGGLLMAALAIIALIYGKKKSEKEWVWMGNLTLLVNLYTQFFLFLWHPLPPALFFFILALSLFILGRKAELIWGRK